jgi:hypothetical protein
MTVTEVVTLFADNGWLPSLKDDRLLARLLKLNLAQCSAGASSLWPRSLGADVQQRAEQSDVVQVELRASDKRRLGARGRGA